MEPVGENGLLGRLTKLVLESALEGEITDHLGYDKYQRSGGETINSRNGALITHEFWPHQRQISIFAR
ncbi:hypothetical protein GCM10022224_016850 [Nonomuraea antimicrobica]|uniref:Transposase, Mutator family n=1 Tax=Nonomuraea antimicrobica TaxID=561173 RepID=A0ABP7BC56_9ACTN